VACTSSITAKRLALKNPAAIVLMLYSCNNYGHYTMVISSICLNAILRYLPRPQSTSPADISDRWS
jgi:hypothetical protein